MTTRENILFLEDFSDILIDMKKYEEMMEFFGMKKFENTPVKNLSIGQRERTNIIRAFVHNPKVVILDEPGSNLDDMNFEKLFTFLEQQKNTGDTLICIATHNEIFKKIATKIISLELIDNE